MFFTAPNPNLTILPIVLKCVSYVDNIDVLWKPI